MLASSAIDSLIRPGETTLQAVNISNSCGLADDPLSDSPSESLDGSLDQFIDQFLSSADLKIGSADADFSKFNTPSYLGSLDIQETQTFIHEILTPSPLPYIVTPRPHTFPSLRPKRNTPTLLQIYHPSELEHK